MWTVPGDLETPALVVDLETLTRNVSSMARAMRERHVALRPHAKTHKSLHVAELQREHGAAGLTVASIGEAEVFAGGGFDDLFIAYPVIAAGGKALRLRALAQRAVTSVGVDSLEAARLLARAGLAGWVSVLVEVDTGQHRSGVPPPAAGELAARCADLGLSVVGVFTHGGHSYRAPDAPEQAARDERELLAEAAAGLRSHGLRVERVSAGSTPTARLSAGGEIDEERPGTYVFNDRQQETLGSASASDIAVAVVATVVSRAVPGQIVIDAGSKSLSTDRPQWLEGFGSVPELDNAPVITVSECHGVVRLGDRPQPPIGTRIAVVPNHVCTAVNLFDHYEVVSNGETVDRWPVSARGHLA